MKVSNRVFWGGVVILSSGLMGQVIAQEKTAKFTEVEAQSFTLLNKDGSTAGRFAVNESTGIPHIVLVKGGHSFGVSMVDKVGPMVMLTRNRKQVVITADGLDGPTNKVEVTGSESPASPASSDSDSARRFSGSSNKKTPPFLIKSGKWKIKWSAKSTDPDGIMLFSVNVYKVSGNRLLQQVAGVQKPGSDTGYVYESGEFYLDISAIGCTYEISVEEAP